jgi:hypothetical protein
MAIDSGGPTMRIGALLGIAIVLTAGPAIALQPRNNPGWYKLDEAELDCLDEALIRRYGTPIEFLDMLGFGPDDPRIRSLWLRCHALIDKRKPSKNEGPKWPK